MPSSHTTQPVDYQPITLSKSVMFRLLKVAFSVYFIVTLSLTTFHLQQEFANSKDKITTQLKMISDSFEPAMDNALWNIDDSGMDSTLEGITHFPIVLGVQVFDGSAQEVFSESGQTTGDNSGVDKLFFVEFNISHQENEGEVAEIIGTGKVFSSNAIVWHDVKVSFLFIIINAMIKTIALWLVFLFIGRRILAVPLRELAHETSKIDLDNLEAINLQVVGENHKHDELCMLQNRINDMIHRLYASKCELEDYAANLEGKVTERTQELATAYEQLAMENERVEAQNLLIHDSIQYARSIQDSLTQGGLLDIGIESFVLWKPLDIVGGDIYFAKKMPNGYLLSVIDCTGHGVPGAFMTMIVASAFELVVQADFHHDPAAVLEFLNRFITKTLKQESKDALSDNGMDMGVCFMNIDDQQLLFSGAKQDLFVVKEGEVSVLKGNKQSIGYRNADLDYTFLNHQVNLLDEQTFYMTTDGYTDQTGGAKGFSFGNRRFKKLLAEVSQLTMVEQKTRLFDEYEAYLGTEDRVDDVTVLGFTGLSMEKK